MVSSILLLIVIDLGFALLLLSSPHGLDVGDLPLFDGLIVSELIAVSLLPAVSVFPVALGNILFILAFLTWEPPSPALREVLASGTAYEVLSRPICLQIIVAVVAYLWLRSALRAIARAVRAKEIAALQRREAERSHQLEIGIQQLLQTQVRAANGDLTARANLGQDNVLWRVGITLNLLLVRLQKASRAERENQRLREEVARLRAASYETRREEARQRSHETCVSARAYDTLLGCHRLQGAVVHPATESVLHGAARAAPCNTRNCIHAARSRLVEEGGSVPCAARSLMNTVYPSSG